MSSASAAGAFWMAMGDLNQCLRNSDYESVVGRACALVANLAALRAGYQTETD